MPNKKVEDESKRRISKPITLPTELWEQIDSNCIFWGRSRLVEKLLIIGLNTDNRKTKNTVANKIIDKYLKKD